MRGNDELANRFEAERGRLRGLAFRMLGALDEADDVVQAAWLRCERADVAAIDNLSAWLTTVVSRVCLDVLRSRRINGESSLTPELASITVAPAAGPDEQAILTDEVGLALLIVLGRLTPHQRVAFVLHDLFAVPFDEIARVVGRAPTTAKKLASRARALVRGASVPKEGVAAARHVALVEAFLAASRGSDMRVLLEVLAPDVVRTADQHAIPSEARRVLRGAAAVAKETRAFARLARGATVMMIDGAPGVVVAPRWVIVRALRLRVEAERIVAIEVIGDPAALDKLVVTPVPVS